LGIGPNPQSPIPNPQSPIPNPHLKNCKFKAENNKNKLILVFQNFNKIYKKNKNV